MLLFMARFLEKIKEKIDRKLEPDFFEFLRKENFPRFLISGNNSDKSRESIKRVSKKEFREMIEKYKPKEIFAEYINTDDFTMWGYFYFRLEEGSIVKTMDYFPQIDLDDNITDSGHSISLEGFPYKELRYNNISGLYKFIRTED